jgi:hypothetical protein
MAYDAIHAETVLHDANAAQPVVYLWNGASWAARQPLTWPGMLNYWTDYAPYMTTDPGTGRPFLAGWNGSTPACWEWSGMLWQQQQPNVPNNGVLFGALSGDTAHARIVMFDVHWLEYPAQPDHTWTLAGSTLERLTTPLGPNPRLRTAMAFDSARGVTVLFGGFLPGTPGTGFPLGDTWEFALGDGPAFSTYGIGCAGSSGRPTVAAQGGAVPRIGQPFALQISNLPLTGPAFLFLGLSDQSYLGHPLPLDLGFLGAPGCPLLCSAESLQVLTNVLGSSVWTFAVPPFPGAVFFNQAVAFDPAANALGLTTSNGGRSVIGM